MVIKHMYGKMSGLQLPTTELLNIKIAPHPTKHIQRSYW